MKTAFWLLYAALTISGVVYYFLCALEKTYERISLPQLFYLIYVVGCGYVLAATGSPYAALLFLGTAFAFVLYLSLNDPPAVEDGLLAELQGRLDAARKALTTQPQDVLALEGAADVYGKLGDPAARPYLERLIAVYGAKRDFDTLRNKTEERLRRLGPGTADEKAGALLRVCRACGALAPKAAFACARCAGAFFPSRAAYGVARVNRLFEEYDLTRTTAYGLAFVPFLYAGGWACYAVLWGVWAMAFTTARK